MVKLQLLTVLACSLKNIFFHDLFLFLTACLGVVPCSHICALPDPNMSLVKVDSVPTESR